MKKRLEYNTTNENIHAIKLGLDQNADDYFYSILGSGDIPFVFLESKSKIFSVDSNPEQVKYAKKRIKALDDNNINFFRNQSFEEAKYEKNVNTRKKYFQNINIEKIKKSIDNLEIICDNFFNLDNRIDYSKFNKVYCSNAMDYLDGNIKAINNNFFNFMSKFNSGTKFYISSYNNLDFKEGNKFSVDKKLSSKLTKVENNWNIYILENK